uniref:TBC1 domain family member 23 n=1 Tax=Panagrolaimus sp. PS1159 TaxID=55785 RepID=A0AC35FQW4_9BILA
MDEVRVDEDELTKEIESFSVISGDDNEEKVYQGVNNNDSGAEISMEARQSQWVNLLGVRNKPDQLIDWDHLYNLNDQAELRKQCQKVVENVQNNGGDRERKTKVTVPALESMMTLWCKKRKIQNASKVHWTDLMTVLIEMDFDNPTLFNIFYAITTKYIPRDIDESGKTYDLFRLIMQYHDPEICSHLDSLKITPHSYASSWFNSLFSKDLDVKLCLQLWDIYFEKGDPFLVFFISLCLIQSARDQILQMKDKNEIITFLRDIPKNMSVEDITDLIDVCKVSMSLTPLSVQEDFHCMLFGANMVEDFYELPLQTLLCLPISVQELYKRSVDGGAYGVMMPYNYFVIDTRSQKEFSSGSIPGSYNLSGRLLVDAPEKFTNAMTTLMRFKKESCASDHICFFGSGLEEDDSYMVMVISSFLHKNVNHISYVDGGYKALHSVLKETNNLNKLSNHFDGNACLHCNGQKAEAKESFTWKLFV